MTQIKLISFNIKNYRSIIESGWCKLSNDNITVLIGQNESGKTTILEALNSFYNNIIDEDVLRSDNSYPIVSCLFKIEEDSHVLDLLDNKKVPKELINVMKNQDTFSLTREWIHRKKSILYISTTEVLDYYKKQRDEEQEIENKTKTEIKYILGETDNLLSELELFEKEKGVVQNEMSERKKILESHQRQLRKAKKPEQKDIAENEIKISESLYQEQQSISNINIEDCENTKKKIQELSEKASIGKLYQDALQKQKEHIKLISEVERKIDELDHMHELCTNEKEKKKVYQRLSLAKSELDSLNRILARTEKELKVALLVAIKVYGEKMKYRQAEREAKKQVTEKDYLYSLNKIGEALYSSLPIFEFFEDFSGLLPNKIDLEDLLNENQHVEGYKAALNFLKIAGLDTAFFRERNHRILKQRIETLNSDVSIDFQDYWSQKVGKDSKIKLHFELEHYDYTVPEKSGKPYIEFWIKDKQHRLYPKQRSRGVRWFLSFYLELKATALRGIDNRVVLIDEPGLSLHARAQEDVLKVFEDLRKKMQIIYCTHSPHLVKNERLYRVLGVQRADQDNDRSESLIFEPDRLSELSVDTLTPIYSIMGVRLAENQLINSKNNIIIPDSISFYYFHFISKLFPELKNINFVPANGVKSVPAMVNIIGGWQLKYGVVLFGSEGEDIKNELIEFSLVGINGGGKTLKLYHEYEMIEDVFSTIDFKKYILLERVGITDKNSEYIKVNDLSRKILATNFVNSFGDGKLDISNFDTITQNNLKQLSLDILNILQT